MNFIDELKRRNVFRVGTAYLLAAWLLFQLSDILVPLFELPTSVQKLVLLLLIIGFIPAVIFAWAFEMTPDGLRKESDVDRSSSIAPQTGRKLDRAIIVVLTLVVAFLLFQQFSPLTGIESSPTQGSEITPSDIEATEKTIAVLPFVNMSSDEEQEYFSDGITEEILNSLATVKDLKVAGRTSSFSFKGQNQDLRVIADALGVDHILEGSVRKSGDRVRITAQLIKADDGFHMWSETYDRELIDIFAIQDEISAAILDQLKAQLIGGESLASAQVDVDTYQLYLKARQLVAQRGPALREALPLLEEIVVADPGFGPAYAQLGICILLLSDRADMYGDFPPDEALAMALPHLEMALELTPELPEALAGMGLYHYQADEYELSKAFLRRSLDRNPSLIDAYNWMYTNLGTQGNYKEGWALAEEIHLRDPLYVPGILNVKQAYYIKGENEKVEQMVTRLKPVWSNLLLEGITAELEANRGNKAAGILRMQELTRNFGGGGYAIGAILHPMQLDLANYEAIVDEEQQFANPRALSRLGRAEEALVILDRLAQRALFIDAYILVLEENREYDKIIELVESRFENLDEFESRFAGSPGFGFPSIGSIAYAYLKTGNTERYEQVRARFGAALDRQLIAGANNSALSLAFVYNSLLNNDVNSALGYYQQAVDQGLFQDPNWPNWYEITDTLVSHPGFAEIHDQMTARVNRERDKLGLEPVFMGDQ